MVLEKSETARVKLRVVGVPCSTCLVPVRRALERTKGINRVGANVMLDLIIVDYDPAQVGPERIIETVKRSGYTAIPATGL